MILKEVKTRKKNLAMGWIDYQKAFDMLPHSWIIDCLYSLGLNIKLITFLQSTMKNWRVKLTCNNENLGEVEIKRGIFQGDSLSPLFFVIALIPLTQILKATRHCYSFANKEKINHLFEVLFFQLLLPHDIVSFAHLAACGKEGLCRLRSLGLPAVC